MMNFVLVKTKSFLAGGWMGLLPATLHQLLNASEKQSSSVRERQILSHRAHPAESRMARPTVPNRP